MKKFYLLMALVTIVLAAVHFILVQLTNLVWHPIFIALYVYFPMITSIIHAVLIKQIDKRPQLFVNYFMGSMSVKLFLSLILLLVVLYTMPKVRVPFALMFMLMYLVYTALSVTIVFKKLKQNA